MKRTLLVTVGSTKFDGLIERIQQDDEGFKDFIKRFEIEKVIIQHGKSKRPTTYFSESIECEIVDYFAPEIMIKLLCNCSVIITHGGAGTLFEILRGNKLRLEALIVVENDGLMDMHQAELVDTLVEIGCPLYRAKGRGIFNADKTEYNTMRGFKLPEPDATLLTTLMILYLK